MIKLLSAINKYYLMTFAKQKSIVLFHGTSSKNLSSILSQGLITNPKEKVWDQDLGASFKNPSRITLGGIYFTTNLDLAISAANNSIKYVNKQKENPIVIIAKAKPSAILADEDDVSLFLSRIKLKNFDINEEKSVRLYAYYCLNKNMKDFQESKQQYIIENLAKIKTLFKKDIHPSLENRIIQLLDNGFISGLKRQIVYINRNIYNRIYSEVFCEGKLSRNIFFEAAKSANENYPEPTEAISEYNSYIDNITKVCKDIFEITGSGRIIQDVGFTGKIKIIGIIEFTNMKDFEYEIVYQNPKELTDEIMSEFESRANNYKIQVF